MISWSSCNYYSDDMLSAWCVKIIGGKIDAQQGTMSVTFFSSEGTCGASLFCTHGTEEKGS
jgi:hypothetical protein